MGLYRFRTLYKPLFLATRHKSNPRMQFALFLLSLAVGPRMIWLINRGSWLVNIRQVCCLRLVKMPSLKVHSIRL